MAGSACASVHNEACSVNDMAAIGAWYHASLAEKCLGQDDRCEAKKEIDAEFHDRLKQWVRCQK